MERCKQFCVVIECIVINEANSANRDINKQQQYCKTQSIDDFSEVNIFTNLNV